MKNSVWLRAMCVTLTWLSLVTSSQSGTLIPVPLVPGSLETDVFDINGNNSVAGTYQASDGNWHAFFGSLDGQYTSFDGDNYQGSIQANGINDDGWITGIYWNSDYCQNNGVVSSCQFVRKPDGTFITIFAQGMPLLGYARQITNKTKFVGDHFNNDLSYSSYVGKAGQYQKKVQFGQQLIDPRARGINSAGIIVGRFTNSENNLSGFVVQNGSLTVVDYPDPTAVNTSLYGINDHGLVTGTWETGAPDYILHAFTYDTTTSTFRPLRVGENASAEGINNAGYIVIRFGSASYVYCPKKKAKCPGGTLNAAFGRGIYVPHEDMLTHRSRQGASRMPPS